MQKEEWLLCPICGNKTRLKIREDTELKNFPLFCPKCKQEVLISIKQFNMSVIKEPDAQTHRRRADELVPVTIYRQKNIVSSLDSHVAS